MKLKIKKTVLFITISLILSCSVFGQSLPRKGFFGALIGDLTKSEANTLKVPDQSGTIIKQVFKGTSANNARFEENDVLISIHNKVIKNTRHFLELLKHFNAEDKIKISYYRQRKLKTKFVVLQPKPKEISNDYNIIYSSVRSGENHLRTIITKPKGDGIYPAVLLIGGVGCYSIDKISHKKLLSTQMWVDSLTMRGFATLRVEKTGMGDSKGLPCKKSDFKTEKQGFLDGLRQLKSLPYVNPEQVFIAGFSMGGVIGPLIAQQEPVKGILVYGTVGRNWFEYELENTHRQQLLSGYPSDSINIRMRAEYKRLYGLFVEKKKPEEIMAQYPETINTFFNYPMNIDYFQQVSDIDIGKLWMNTTANVLAMHGTADFVSSAAEHELIAKIVNRYHPNNATYIKVENADHWELYAKSEKISQQNKQTGLNPISVNTAINWILKVLSY